MHPSVCFGLEFVPAGPPTACFQAHAVGRSSRIAYGWHDADTARLMQPGYAWARLLSLRRVALRDSSRGFRVRSVVVPPVVEVIRRSATSSLTPPQSPSRSTYALGHSRLVCAGTASLGTLGKGAERTTKNTALLEHGDAPFLRAASSDRFAANWVSSCAHPARRPCPGPCCGRLSPWRPAR